MFSQYYIKIKYSFVLLRLHISVPLQVHSLRLLKGLYCSVQWSFLCSASFICKNVAMKGLLQSVDVHSLALRAHKLNTSDQNSLGVRGERGPTLCWCMHACMPPSTQPLSSWELSRIQQAAHSTVCEHRLRGEEVGVQRTPGVTEQISRGICLNVAPAVRFSISHAHSRTMSHSTPQGGLKWRHLVTASALVAGSLILFASKSALKSVSAGRFICPREIVLTVQ